MNFARTIVSSERLIDILDLPDDLKHREVEIIVLPTHTIHSERKNSHVNVVDELIDNPLQIKDFHPFDRKEIYER